MEDFAVELDSRNQASKSSYVKFKAGSALKNRSSKALDSDFTFDDLA